jgi:hypothetical protein
LTPAADSAAFGPARSARTAVRTGNVAAAAVRLVCQRRAERLNHTLIVVEACEVG